MVNLCINKIHPDLPPHAGGDGHRCQRYVRQSRQEPRPVPHSRLQQRSVHQRSVLHELRAHADHSHRSCQPHHRGGVRGGADEAFQQREGYV